MSDIAVIPAPTATVSIWTNGKQVGRAVGVDLVCDPVDGITRVLVPFGDTSLSFRLDFDRAQIGALMDELVGLADATEQQAELAGLSYGGC